jgi:hypothetical protein
LRLRAAACAALAALALGGCESTQEKSAKLEKVAKVREATEQARTATQRRLLTIAHPSRRVSVAGVALLSSSEGLATVVTLHNRSSVALREVPVRVTVRDARGAALFTNEQPGQAAPLIAVSYVPPHATVTWVDDQIPPDASAHSATAKVGEGRAGTPAVPALEVSGVRQTDDASGAGAEGEVVNRSATAQRELVVYAVVRRGAAVLAAGRAVVPNLGAGSSARFQLFFIGDPAGGRLEVAAPPATFG